MSSLRLALKQSLEESGIVPAKMARDKERKRMEVEYRKKKMKQQQQQQQQQQQRRKPGDPPRKRGRPPKIRPPLEQQQQPPVPPSEHHQEEGNDNHDDDSSEVEATFSSDEGFVGHEDSDSHREESSHHSNANDTVDGKREAEDSLPNTMAAFPPKITSVVPGKTDFEEEEEDEDEGYHNQDEEDVDEEESHNSERAARKTLQRTQVSAANMIKRGWKKKKGIVDNPRENFIVSSASSTTSSLEPPVAASLAPEESQEAKPKSSLPPPPPSVKKMPKEPMERNKKDSNPQKAKTVPAPSKELIEWMRSLPKKKMKRHVLPGLRVKVRFAARIKRDGKSIRKLKWYGGVVSKVGKDGSKIRIKYDDGTSEISPFPDPDIVVDDESNGQHECPADWFIPEPMEDDDDDNDNNHDIDETPSSPRAEKKLKRHHEASEPPYEEQPSMTSSPPPSRPPKKMRRSLTTLATKLEGGEEETSVVPAVMSSVSSETMEPVEPKKLKKKHHVVADAVKKEFHEDTLPDTQLIVAEPPLADAAVDEAVAPASMDVIDAPEATTMETVKAIELVARPTLGHESIPHDNETLMPVEEFKTNFGMSLTKETAQPDVEMADTSTTHNEEPSETPKLPMLTIRLSKHVPNVNEQVDDEDDKVVSPGKSPSSDMVLPSANDESGDDEEEDEEELLVERSNNDSALHDSKEESARAISADPDAEKEKRPSKRIYIKLDMDAVERSATIEEEPACGDTEDGDSQTNITTEPSDSTIGEKLDPAVLDSSARGVDDTDATSPPPVDDNVKAPAAVVSVSGKRHGKGIDRLDEVIKPRRLTPIARTESPTALSSEPLNAVSESELLKPLSSSTGESEVGHRVLSDEASAKKVPLLTSSKNSAFSKKESSSLSKKDLPNSLVPSKAALRIAMREQQTGEDDESIDALGAIPKQRGSKSSTAPRVGRRAAQQANQRISAKQDAIQEAIAKKKRKREKAEGRKREDGDESESSEDDRQWVQCDNCRKWRLLPTKIELSMLPKHWYCEMNTYDPKRSSCVAPEQTAVEFAKEKKRAKKQRLRQRTESPEDAEENSPDEPIEKRESKAEHSKRILVRSPIPVKEKDSSIKGSIKTDHEHESKPKRTSPDSTALGYRSPIPERETEHQKSEKRLPGQSAKKNRVVEPSEGASSSDGALEVIKVRGRGRGRTRIAKDSDKDQEKPAGAKSSSHDTNEADNVEWVQCEKCDKWRKLPPHIAADDLPDVWYCSMNTWNPSSASCEAAEDKADGYTHELSIFGGSPSNSNKLSYRNLIFGTGKKFNRPISERTRAMESLFAVPADDNDGYPTVMYANSCAFVPRAGLRGTSDANGNSNSLSFLDLMKHSSLWAELRGVGEKLNNYSYGNFGHQYQRRTSFESFTAEMRQSMKDLVRHSLGTRTLAGHEVLLEAQCRQWENVPPAWAELRPYCTVEIVVSALVDLVKDGAVELVEEPGVDRTSKDWIPRYRCANLKSEEPAPATLPDEGVRVSRCIKISKPWKHAQTNNQWMLHS